jgi:hypothetical protein
VVSWRIEPFDDYNVGGIVFVTSGPLAGYCAIFDYYLLGHERVSVIMQILQDQ